MPPVPRDRVTLYTHCSFRDSWRWNLCEGHQKRKGKWKVLVKFFLIALLLITVGNLPADDGNRVFVHAPHITVEERLHTFLDLQCPSRVWCRRRPPHQGRYGAGAGLQDTHRSQSLTSEKRRWCLGDQPQPRTCVSPFSI